MNIHFLNDGSIEGLATEEVQRFLSKLGNIEDLGVSKVELVHHKHNRLVYKIYDEHGHKCSDCGHFHMYFMLICFENTNEEILYCLDCFKCNYKQ